MSKKFTEEEKQQVIKKHHDELQEIEDSLSELEKQLGRNHSVFKKMNQVFDIFKSFTDEELLEMELINQYLP